jgi:co-chaperonin GroES (HSP10)
MELKDILDLKTVSGYPVRKLRMRGGHNLLMKLRIPGSTDKGLLLPDRFTRRSIENVVSTKGLVVIASEPFRPKLLKTKYKWNNALSCPTPHSETRDAQFMVESSVQAGDHVLYTSYNIGKVEVVGLDEPLVIVREIDIIASFAADYDSHVELGDHTMNTTYTTKS